MKRIKKEYRLGNYNLSISLPTELLLELNKLANKSGISRNKLIRHSIQELLQKERTNPPRAKSPRQPTDVAALLRVYPVD